MTDATTDPGADDAEGTPPASGWRAVVARADDRLTEARSWVETRVPGIVVAFEGFDRYQRLNGAALAGHIAFRLFSWLVPVVMVTVVATGLASDGGVDVEGQASTNLGLGGSLASTLRQTSQDTQSSRIHLAVVAVSGLLLATSGLLSALYATHATLWEVPDRRVRSRGRLLSRLLGGMPLFVLIILASSALRSAGLVGGAAGTTLTLVVVFGVLMGLGWILPRRATDVRDLLPGAAVGTALMVGLQAFTTWYLVGRVSRMSATYGAFGIALTLLLYLYLLGQIIVVATLVNAMVYDRRPGTSATAHDPLVDEALDADGMVWP